MAQKRKTKNTPMICPNCLKIFKIEYRENYAYKIVKNKKRIFFCSSKCMNEYKKYNDRIELFNSILGND